MSLYTVYFVSHLYLANKEIINKSIFLFVQHSRTKLAERRIALVKELPSPTSGLDGDGTVRPSFIVIDDNS